MLSVSRTSCRSIFRSLQPISEAFRLPYAQPQCGLPRFQQSRIARYCTWGCGGIRCLSSKTATEDVVFRYFDYRGRSQALRYALIDAGVSFKDEKIPISQIISGNWFNTKTNSAISGAFGRLPVLEWKGFQLSQNEAIARYLYNKLEHGPPENVDKEALSASLTSLAFVPFIAHGFLPGCVHPDAVDWILHRHQDMIVMCLQLANNISQVPPEVDDKHLVRPVQELQVRLNGIIMKLEAMLAACKHDFFTGEEPVMGDYFVFEALDVVTTVYGDEALNSCPNLENFVIRMQERPRLKAYLDSEERPGLLGTENEGEVMMRVHRDALELPMMEACRIAIDARARRMRGRVGSSVRVQACELQNQNELRPLRLAETILHLFPNR